MLFSSMTFIYVFLPILLALYYISPKKLRNTVLLFASLIFYAWGEPKYVTIMLTCVVVNYLGALALTRWTKVAKPILGFTVLVNLGFLFYFKYFNFVFENVNKLFSTHVDFITVVMPIGISFYTFQSMSYLIDVYRKATDVQKNPFKLMLYVSFFPQLVAGPIVKYHDVNDQIDNRVVTIDSFCEGIRRFIIGLSKKMLLANTLGAVADKIFQVQPDQLDPITCWIGALCYSLQLVFDFSGYSDMAIGLGLMFGFRFMENFNYPYISKSITEFWRRWHISLSTWFKEYLYIPLGGNRKGSVRTYVNLFLVFLATGIWHGAEWTFVVWGLWHGLFIILEKFTGWHKPKGLILTGIQRGYALLVAILGWVLFRATDLTYAIKYIRNMFGCLSVDEVFAPFTFYVTRFDGVVCLIAMLCSIPLLTRWQYKNQFALVRLGLNATCLVLLFLSTMVIAGSSFNPFIYFRF